MFSDPSFGFFGGFFGESNQQVTAEGREISAHLSQVPLYLLQFGPKLNSLRVVKSPFEEFSRAGIELLFCCFRLLPEKLLKLRLQFELNVLLRLWHRRSCYVSQRACPYKSASVVYH